MATEHAAKFRARSRKDARAHALMSECAGFVLAAAQVPFEIQEVSLCTTIKSSLAPVALGRLIRSGEVTAVLAARVYLNRIER